MFYYNSHISEFIERAAIATNGYHNVPALLAYKDSLIKISHEKVSVKIHHLNDNSPRLFRTTFIASGKVVDFKTQNSHINSLS